MKKKMPIVALVFSLLLLNTQSAQAQLYDVCESQIPDGEDYERARLSCIRRITSEEFGGDHCIDCNLPELPEINPWAEVAKVAIGGIAAVLPTYYSAKYAHKSAKAWATSYENGITSCHGAIDTYNAQLLERGSNPVLADQQNSMLATCNGYGMGAYAGYGGMYGGMYGGVYNPMIAGGYTPGFTGGMMGPNYGYGGGIYGPGGVYGGAYGPGGLNGGISVGGGNPWAIMAGGALASMLTGGSIHGNINGQIGYPGIGVGVGTGYP